MKLLRILGVLVGLTMIVVLIRQAGWSLIGSTLTLLGWKYLIVLIYPFSWMVLNTVGWWYACPPDQAADRPGPKLTLKKLVAIRLAGETFNSLLPSGYVGGEPVKAKLLSAWMPLRDAASSVLIAKAAQSIGLLFFIGLGLAVGLPPGAASAQRNQAWIALAILTAGVLIFTILLAKQSFSRVGKVVHRLTGFSWIAAQQKRLEGLDASLGGFYRGHRGRFFSSILWHAAGWGAGMLELVLIFYLAGCPVSWRQAWFMGALAQLGSVIGLMSPGGLGFYEGGHYVAAVVLGLPPALGISASLIRRVREIFWVAAGLYFFNKYSKAPVEIVSPS